MDQKKMTMSNISTIGVFKDALRISIKRPSLALFFLKTLISQKRAQRNRLKWIKEGIQVPPVMIFSITNKCNLNCKGCYNKALRISSKDLQHFLQDCRLKKNYLEGVFLQEEVLFM